MKTNSLWVFTSILLSSCQAAPPPLITPAAPPAPAAVLPAPTNVRAPEVVKTYTIGAYVDPEDPTLRHEAHTVHRIEAAAYWDLRPIAETQTLQPRESAKTEHSQTAPEPTKGPPPAVVMAPPPPPVELTIDPEPALMPNADGIIDLASVETPPTGEVNPFAVRSTPAQPPREIGLRVTGILAGAKPCALINGQLVEPGGMIEGFSLKRIEPSAVVLTSGRHRIRVPISADPVRVRTTP
ncbi:MAG: hypothetical protein PSU94_06370 [Lacunisphaera sp.]|nr:hypothetical protein [Lacunisphaera sp.]